MVAILDNSDEFFDETFEQLDVAEQTLSKKEFDNCRFIECDFSSAEWSHCKFSDCEFIRCNLSNVKLGFSKFNDVSFTESKMIGIDWTRASWPRMVFSAPIRFYQCLLNDASFNGLHLPELVLEDCKVHGVDFRDGNFQLGRFNYCDFSGSLFSNTDLGECDFTEATDYDIDVLNNRIKQAKFSRYEAIRLLQGLDIELLD